MKVCMIQSYSKNNENLFNLTIGNHIKYCNKYEYSILAKNEPYSATINCKQFKNLLNNYDLIFTIGSDVLLTNLDKKIEDFLDKSYPMSICKEGHAFTYVNGEILFFWNTKKSFEILDYLEQIQMDNPNIFHGTQGVINQLFYSKNEITKYIHLIEQGTLQKYLYTDNELQARINLQNYFININNIPMGQENIYPLEKFIWHDKQDFCAHAIGGSNQEKFNNLLNIIKNDPSLIQIL